MSLNESLLYTTSLLLSWLLNASYWNYLIQDVKDRFWTEYRIEHHHAAVLRAFEEDQSHSGYSVPGLD